MDDDELRDRLRAVDPASSVPPLDPARSESLMEAAMSEQNDRTDQNDLDQTGRAGKGRSTPLLIAAAAVTAIVGVGALFLAGDRDDAPPVASDPASPASPSAQPTPTPTESAPGTESTALVLEAPAPTSARCAVPTPELLRRADVAVDATASEVSESSVVLSPRVFYSGDGADEIRVEAPPAALRALIGAVEFEEGERYLVSAVEGRVTVCGFSGPYSPEREQLYIDAFGR